MKLNLGCGPTSIPGFLGVDHRSNIGNLTEDAFTLPSIEPSSVDEIFASHVLEHACFDRTIDVLRRWHEILKPGGLLWVLVPDFRRVPRYLNDCEAGKITFEYFNSRIFGNAGVAKEMYGDLPSLTRGIRMYELAFHRAVFTPSILTALLQNAGFSDIRRQSAIPYRLLSSKEFCLCSRT